MLTNRWVAVSHKYHAGNWTRVPHVGKQLGGPLDQWNCVWMQWDCRLSIVQHFTNNSQGFTNYLPHYKWSGLKWQKKRFSYNPRKCPFKLRKKHPLPQHWSISHRLTPLLTHLTFCWTISLSSKAVRQLSSRGCQCYINCNGVTRYHLCYVLRAITFSSDNGSTLSER